ncbi:hypothetical protein BSZ35_13345 [Salinibacter sp. 10B]|nr:hypothetical protein BSZ35_13345 [Salinibacter sp. 10B]
MLKKKGLLFSFAPFLVMFFIATTPLNIAVEPPTFEVGSRAETINYEMMSTVFSGSSQISCVKHAAD